MADGKTYEEAVRNAQKVIEEWIETARELGREIPVLKGRAIFTTLTGVVIGFAYWDRRIIIRKARDEAIEIICTCRG